MDVVKTNGSRIIQLNFQINLLLEIENSFAFFPGEIAVDPAAGIEFGQGRYVI